MTPIIHGFDNRRQAGQLLAQRLTHLAAKHPIILALPRGGVPVAFEVAKVLQAPLDLLFVRKIGAPGREEFGIGAVMDGDQPQLVLNDDIIRHIAPDQGGVLAEIQRQLAEIRRRRLAYGSSCPGLPIAGRTVVIVDDGIATGSTMKAALRGARTHGADWLVLAVPVAPPSTIAELEPECDEVVCLIMPERLGAVGAFYGDFTQTDDDEVVSLLHEAQTFGSHDVTSAAPS